MEKTKHTPGPWRAYGTTIVTQRGENDGPIAQALSAWVSQSGCEANARLIAAAPDLLKHLEHLAAACEQFAPFILTDEARAAIAKAKGEE